MHPFFDLTKAAVWRMHNARNCPVSVLHSSATGVYLHKITFLGDGRWCFANAYDKHKAVTA